MDYSKQQFEQLYKEHYARMYRLAYAMVENQEDARDVVSMVFTLVWQRQPQVDDGAWPGYLLVATRNQCLHVIRQRHLRMEAEEEMLHESEPTEDQDRQEMLEQLYRIIRENLTEQDRRVLSLHFDEEMTYRETAAVLGISSAAVNKHVTQSLAKIRRILGLGE